MIKGTSQNIVCNQCNSIVGNERINHLRYYTVTGKQGQTLHYCPLCIAFVNHIPLTAFKSPALKHKNSDYPAIFNEQVPLKIRMIKTVKSDLPFKVNATATEKSEYYCWVNSYGTISAILPDGEELGVKPDEFEVIEFHPVNARIF